MLMVIALGPWRRANLCRITNKHRDLYQPIEAEANYPVDESSQHVYFEIGQ